jgi:hypothetical protein
LLVRHQVGYAANWRGHHCQARVHGLEQGDRYTLLKAREAKNVGCGKERPLSFSFDPSRKLHFVLNSKLFGYGVFPSEM